MKYSYSIVRFVPNPTAGEFINIGIIAGSDDNHEWMLRTVSRLDRAQYMDTIGILPSVMDDVDAIREMLKQPDFSERKLIRLSYDMGNTLQVTPPMPMTADSAKDGINSLWNHLIIEPETDDSKLH